MGDRSQVAPLIDERALSAKSRAYVESARSGAMLSYAELRARAIAWGEYLDELSLPIGAVVALLVAEPLAFTTGFLGIISSGRIVAPLDPGAGDQEMLTAIARAGTDVVFADQHRSVPSAVRWIQIDDEALERRTNRGATSGKEWGGSRGGVLLSTSGTTGRPKRIILDEDQLLYAARSIVDGHRISDSDRGFSPLPLFHINAEVVGLLGTLVAGSTLVLDDRFHRTAFWQTVSDYGITWINVVPAILARLTPLRAGESVPSSVRFARSASAPLAPAVLRRFEAETGVPIVETYGMTEGCSQITANPVDGPRKAGSVGRAVSVELRIARGGASHEDYPGRSVGPVEIRGESIITSYASPGYEDRFVDGWLQTGDLGYLDEDDYLFLVGRVDDVINRGGEKIFPREVEETIVAIEDVVSVVVVGRKDEVFGQVPVAHLVLREGASNDAEVMEKLLRQIHEHCTNNLSKPKRPVAYSVVERLPASATGKVRRHQVHDEQPLAVWEVT